PRHQPAQCPNRTVPRHRWRRRRATGHRRQRGQHRRRAMTTADVMAVQAPDAVSAPVLEVRALRKTYGHGHAAVHALRGVDLTVRRGDYVAIIGASGSGKSTLLNVLGCLDHPTSGTYHLEGIEVSSFSERQLSLLRN